MFWVIVASALFGLVAIVVSVFKKKLIGSASAEYEEICEVPFNPVSKSYEHVLTDPEIGYYYRLEWER